MKATGLMNTSISFNPDHLVMITGKRPHDADLRLYLFGVGLNPVPLAGDAASFVAALPNAKSFAQLHFAVNNQPFWVNGDTVRSIRLPTQAEVKNAPNTNSVIVIGAGERFLLEDIATATSAINAAGGNL